MKGIVIYNVNIAKVVCCTNENVIFGCKYGSLLQPYILNVGFVMDRDVKNICTRGYPRIKPTMGRKQILKMNTRYLRVRVFLILAC